MADAVKNSDNQAVKQSRTQAIKQMIDSKLLPSDRDLNGLVPKKISLAGGKPLYLFHSHSVDILKLDFVYNAGSALQPKPLCAGLARDMLLDASPTHTVSQVAEMFDRLGVAIDRQLTASTAKISVYTLKKYAAQVYPVLRDLLQEPLFGSNEYDILVSKRRQILLANQMKTSMVARNIFYQAIYGPDHPEGRYSVPGDEQRISLDEVRVFAKERLTLNNATLVLAGNYDDETLKLIDNCFATPNTTENPDYSGILESSASQVPQKIKSQIPASVQTTLRIGRMMPIAWDDPDYPMFMILNTVLGGYFGSRLMANIREEKGYTYGIHSMTNMVRGSSVFYITTDVANEVAEPALAEIYKEIELLRSESVSDDELNLVCNYMAGDFLRSIDGIFERSERFYNMMDTRIDERFTRNFFDALRTVTPEKLRQIARQFLTPGDMTEVVVGAQ